MPCKTVERIPRTCLNCDNEFFVYPISKQKFCDAKCAGQHKVKQHCKGFDKLAYLLV